MHATEETRPIWLRHAWRSDVYICVCLCDFARACACRFLSLLCWRLFGFPWPNMCSYTNHNIQPPHGTIAHLHREWYQSLSESLRNGCSACRCSSCRAWLPRNPACTLPARVQCTHTRACRRRFCYTCLLLNIRSLLPRVLRHVCLPPPLLCLMLRARLTRHCACTRAALAVSTPCDWRLFVVAFVVLQR